MQKNPSDRMIVALMGIFVLPIAGFENPELPGLELGLSIILFAGYLFALAGHYDLYTRGGKRSYAYCIPSLRT
ncbi:MAG: hypothetical protein J5U19_13650 [Candidatus Methanoperedens sp.]|nr:hypothetical protein [Candidatus Methanoperedens sp.]